MKKLAIIMFVLVSNPLFGGDFDTSYSANLELFYSSYEVAMDSVFNPENLVARIPKEELHTQIRVDFTAASDDLVIQLKPRLQKQWLSSAEEGVDDDEYYLHEGRLQVYFANSSISVKRQFMTWGASQFASPSNPFFKSNNASNPFIEPAGRDFLELSVDISDSLSAQLIYNYNVGRDAISFPEFEKISAIKLDYVDEKFTTSFLVGERAQDYHIGVYGQYTLTDALLGYVDIGYRDYSFVQVAQWDINNNFWVNAPRNQESKGATDILIGTSYTFLNGTTLNVEYRHNNEGFSDTENENFYEGARSAIVDIEQNQNVDAAYAYLITSFDNYARSLNKNYLHVQYFARDVIPDLGITTLLEHGFDDSSTKAHLIANYYINDNFRFSTNIIYNIGGSEGEYGRYLDNLIFTGIKYYF